MTSHFDHRPSCRASRRHPRQRTRRGIALLVCVFVMSVCFTLVLNVCDTESLQSTALNNTLDYQKALYLANAAAHDALQQLETNYAWTAGIPSTPFPPGSATSFYSATVASGTGGTVIINASGTSNTTTRKVQITITQGA
ncbi:MAG TPA: hypothetical protein VFE24_14830 [Pirellulales bacterium]|jgi:Tfp pilus assembly protein PilX|nr:hypothetical protein [Pirellulales bacterium]